MVEPGRASSRRPAQPRPRHRGQPPGAAPGRAAARGSGPPLVADRGRGAEPRPRGPGVRPARPASAAVVAAGSPARAVGALAAGRGAGRRSSRPVSSAPGPRSREPAGAHPPCLSCGARPTATRATRIRSSTRWTWRCATARSSGSSGANEAGKSTICLVASGLAPAVDRRRAARRAPDRRRADGRSLGPRARAVGRDRLPEPEDAAIRDRRHGLRGDRAGPDEPGAAGGRDVDRTRGALATLRIEHLADRDPARLSGGQGQLVAIAGLLAMRPRHVILDEPTAQLDPEGPSSSPRRSAISPRPAPRSSSRSSEPTSSTGSAIAWRWWMAAASSSTGPQPQPSRTRGWTAGEWSRRRGCAWRAHWPRAGLPALAELGLAGMSATDQGTAAAAIEVAGLVHVYPDGTRALDGVDLRDRRRRGRRDRRAERQRQDHARPPPQRAASTDRGDAS